MHLFKIILSLFFLINLVLTSDLISFDVENCAKGQMEVEFEIQYLTKNIIVETSRFVMTNTSVKIECFTNKEVILRVISGKDELKLKWLFSWFWSSLRLSEVHFSFIEDKERFPNSLQPGAKIVYKSTTNWSVGIHHVYRCSNFTTFNIQDGAVMTLRNVTWQFFDTEIVPTDDNTVHCSSDSAGSLKPIEPTSVFNFDLKIDDKVVGKIQGNFKFHINYETIIANSTKAADFNLVSAGSTVNGTQTGEKTVFDIFAKDNVKKNDVEWSLTFEKSSKGEVKLVRSTVRYNTTGWPQSKNDVVTVEWTNAIPMANSSSNAYKCSSVEMINGQDYFVITDARIQPFDVKDSKFGNDVVCAEDQPTPPPVGNWTVTQIGASSYTCITITSHIYLMINYTTTDGTNATAVVVVPANASVGSEKGNSCNYNFDTNKMDGNDQVLQLTFIPDGQKSWNNWVLTLTFTNNSVFTGNSKNVDVYKADLQFYYDPAIFPRAKQTGSGHFYNNVNTTSGDGALKMFDTSNDHSYRCNANETTTVDPDFFWIKTDTLRVEAFLQNSTTLLTEHVCTLDQQQETSDLIPIIIGAALAALVVIVLVAYLIGRARARGSNYETI